MNLLLNNKRSIFAAILSISTQSICWADTFQYEAGASISEYDFLTFNGSSLDIYGNYYLEPVNTNKGPLAEAAFLDMASHVSLAYTADDLDDYEDTLTGRLSFKNKSLRGPIDKIRLGGRLVLQEQWILEATYIDAALDLDPESDDEKKEVDISEFSISGGMYLSPTTALIASFASGDYDTDDNAKVFGLDFHHYSPKNNMAGLAYDVEFEYADNHVGNKAYSGYSLLGGLTYYFNKEISISGAYIIGNISEDNLEAEDGFVGLDNDLSGTHLKYTYFINEAVSFSVFYESNEANVNGNSYDIDEYGISALMRF